MQARRIERRSLSISSKPAARLVVVADSHGRPHAASAGLIARQCPDLILHAGDIGGLSVLDALTKIAPVYAVRGNIDGHHASTPDVFVLGLTAHGKKLTILLTHIAVYGPWLRKPEKQLAHAERANLVVCGHSHVPLIAEEGSLAVFNPGSFGPRRDYLPITFGIIELGDAGLFLRHVDCETGKDWAPPAVAP